MKYNGFYFWMFKSLMKKILAEKYGREYAADIMKKSKKVYRELVEKADDIGNDNPMAYNELFALAFVAPYVASEKKNSAGNRAENDAPLTLSYQVVLCKDRLEYRQGEGGEQKERCQIRQVVYARKGGEIPDLIQGGFHRAAVRGCLLLPHYPLSNLFLCAKSRCFRTDAVVL